LDNEHNDAHDKVAMYGRSFYPWDRVFERDETDTKQEREDGNDGRLDDERDENPILVRWLETAWVTKGATHKVPEELAVDKCPDAGPNSVARCDEGDEACIFVPHKFAHRILELAWVDLVLK